MKTKAFCDCCGSETQKPRAADQNKAHQQRMLKSELEALRTRRGKLEKELAECVSRISKVEEALGLEES